MSIDRSIFVAQPDMTPEAWAAELAGTRIAKESTPNVLYDIVEMTRHADRRYLSHAFMLALTYTEHRYGMDPNSIEAQFDTNSWGMRRSKAKPMLAGSVVTTPRGQFVKYPVWAQSLADCCYALSAPEFVYQREHRETIRAVIERWSPAGDFDNAPERRMATIATMMDRLALSAPPQQATGTMPPKPPAIDTSHPSPNRGYKNGHTRRVDAIVDHITDGKDSLGWLTSPASNASANYLIRRDGYIYELVPPTEDAWANGAVNKPNKANPLIAKWVAEGCNFNQRTISIEHECLRTERITEAQMAATIALQAWLCQRFNLTPTIAIFGHNQIDTVNRPHCPGFTAVEWDKLFDGILAALKPSQPAPFQHAPGFIGPPIVDTHTWQPDSAGIITKRILEVYNDQEKKYYRLTWTPEAGNTAEEIR